MTPLLITQPGGRAPIGMPTPMRDATALQGLVGLYHPLASIIAKARVDGSSFYTDIRNLAPYQYGAARGVGYWQGDNGGAGSEINTHTDTYGAYWDIQSTSRMRIAGVGTNIPWQLGAGSHKPVTLMSVFMCTDVATSSSTHLTMCGPTGSGNSNVVLGTRNVSSAMQVYGSIDTGGTTREILNGTSLTIGHPYMALFTSRSNTDHELVVRNLITGTVTGGTSTGDCGTTGFDPLYYQMFFRTSFGDLDFADKLRFYQFGLWVVGKSSDELRQITTLTNTLTGSDVLPTNVGIVGSTRFYVSPTMLA